MKTIIEIYTDGSCNPKYKIGAWAALIFDGNEKIVLQGNAKETTHNRMELIAVINAIEYVQKEVLDFKLIKIYTDSQYVARIPFRATKLISKDLKTKSGKRIQNSDLIQKLIDLLKSANIEFIKVEAHQKSTVITFGEGYAVPNYNREVDKLSRKLVRNQIEQLLL